MGSLIAKIQALLAKAEATEFEAESEAFYAKAQQLMIEHAITEQHLRDAAPVGGAKEQPIVLRYQFTTSVANHNGKRALLGACARQNRCRVIFHQDPRTRQAGKECSIVGFRSDVEFVQILNASLWVQAFRDSKRSCWSSSQVSAFLVGFAQECEDRMEQVNAKVEEDQPPGNALALRDVNLVVRDAFKEFFPQSRTMRSRGVDANAYHRGRAAGKNADISGGRRNLGSTKALSR